MHFGVHSNGGNFDPVGGYKSWDFSSLAIRMMLSVEVRFWRLKFLSEVRQPLFLFKH